MSALGCCVDANVSPPLGYAFSRDNSLRAGVLFLRHTSIGKRRCSHRQFPLVYRMYSRICTGSMGGVLLGMHVGTMTLGDTMAAFNNCSILLLIIALLSLSSISTSHAARSLLQLPNLPTITTPSLPQSPNIPNLSTSAATLPLPSLPPLPANTPLPNTPTIPDIPTLSPPPSN
ncbi:hypothetical protein HAX54_001296 [Datura stramonium]|uniref:Uncharacterized protein n=1 Tax=Datura stramonium TaxID=4076 RepID=A0ABS8RSY2_DATST|nr:hypothetical protein [Datura stramonium]